MTPSMESSSNPKSKESRPENFVRCEVCECYDQLDKHEVENLIRRLEREWSEHDKQITEWTRVQDRLESFRLVLERKLKVIEDLKKYPNSKMNMSKGLDEFLWLYDVVFVQNRDMEHDLGILTKELKDLEMENGELLVETK
jgi:hypothetical protein